MYTLQSKKAIYAVGTNKVILNKTVTYEIIILMLAWGYVS